MGFGFFFLFLSVCYSVHILNTVLFLSGKRNIAFQGKVNKYTVSVRTESPGTSVYRTVLCKSLCLSDKSLLRNHISHCRNDRSKALSLL